MSKAQEIQLHPEWLAVLGGEFEQPYMVALKRFLMQRREQGAVIYPPGGQIFNALNTTPLSEVKVVILGQDPYHGPGQAHGLCFSVQPGVPAPPSLVNIFKELEQDLGCTPPRHGYLQAWAERGVLLLNAVLTVERGQAGSHRDKGWEQFTDTAIAVVNELRDNVVFMLWGAQAARKGTRIDTRRHLILQAPHPSPLSAHRGFFGCKHFSRANEYLESNGRGAVDWQLPENV